ncbi:glycoside hydrolase family 16 protein [Streptomyces sp. CA-249302]|uniref:glycoside hydrolase family 16 protein n=1 Tax=Streptomyces sp. CA-249302 TaxID=3240058 RepID=UPI003D8D20B4
MTARRAHRTALGILMMLIAACAGGTRPGAPASPPPTQAKSSVPPAPGNWKLVFHDDFDGARLDTSRWATCYDWNRNGCTIGTSKELEWYRPGQVSVGGGKLTLTATRRPTNGSDGRVHSWTSGMISTGRDNWYAQPRHTFTYGYFEAAIRIPSENGMSPQFWMMPASRHTPPEIDIMEFLSTTHELSMYIHFRGPKGTDKHRGAHFKSPGFPDGYHVFALLWDVRKLVWYVDGVERWRVTDPAEVPKVPMEVIVNLAVGLPHPPPRSVDSARMSVDWVRVWQR